MENLLSRIDQEFTSNLNENHCQKDQDCTILFSHNKYKTLKQQIEVPSIITRENRKEDKIRFFMGFLYCLCIFLVSFSKSMITNFDLTIAYVNFPQFFLNKQSYDLNRSTAFNLDIVGHIAQILLFIPSVYIIIFQEIRIGFVIGLSLGLFGSILQIFIEAHIQFVYIGFAVMNIGSMIILCSLGYFCTIWFNSKHRGTAIAICYIFDPIGTTFAYIVPSRFVYIGDTEDKMNLRQRLFNLLQTQSFCYLICLLVVGVLIQNGPKDDRNYSKYVKSLKKNFGMKRQMKQLFTDKIFMIFQLGGSLLATTLHVFEKKFLMIVLPFDITLVIFS